MPCAGRPEVHRCTPVPAARPERGLPDCRARRAATPGPREDRVTARVRRNAHVRLAADAPGGRRERRVPRARCGLPAGYPHGPAVDPGGQGFPVREQRKARAARCIRAGARERDRSEPETSGGRAEVAHDVEVVCVVALRPDRDGVAARVHADLVGLNPKRSAREVVGVRPGRRSGRPDRRLEDAPLADVVHPDDRGGAVRVERDLRGGADAGPRHFDRRLPRRCAVRAARRLDDVDARKRRGLRRAVGALLVVPHHDRISRGVESQLRAERPIRRRQADRRLPRRRRAGSLHQRQHADEHEHDAARHCGTTTLAVKIGVDRVHSSTVTAA